MQKRGYFITLEGGEGAGKSTQQRMLVRRVRALGHPVLATREPGATPLGAWIRDVVRSPAGGQPSDAAELMLYLADRAQHVEQVVAPALARGEVVISDRFGDSSEVYQGLCRGLGMERVRELNRMVCGEAWPDLTLLLDLDAESGLRRALERQDSLGLGLDRLELEGLAFHRQVRQGFLELAAAEPGRFRLIDAAAPQDVVAERIWDQVQPALERWAP